MSKNLVINFVVIVLISILMLMPMKAFASNEIAIFSGGCFWCLEHDFEEVKGVTSVLSGYTGGIIANPSYRQVSSEMTGHKESIQISYDPKIVSYEQLLLSYWRNIDPFDADGQFCDRGDSYKPVIFTNSAEQKSQAMDSLIKASKEIGVPVERIKVKIEDSEQFWNAEDYHQDYSVKNSLKYNFYRYSCGRDSRLEEVWGDNSRTNAPWGPLGEEKY